MEKNYLFDTISAITKAQSDAYKAGEDGQQSIIRAQGQTIEELQKIVTRLDGHEWEYVGRLKSGKRYYLADRYAVEQDHTYLVDPTEEELAEIKA